MINNGILSTKELLSKINRSKSYTDSFQDCLELMIRTGISENFLENVKDKKICSYEEGMYIVKAFDINNFKPKMKWLPDKIKTMYQ